MIAVDTSAIVAMAFDEAEAEPFTRLIVERSAIVGTPTLVEASAVLSRLRSDIAEAFLARLVATPAIRTVDFTFEMAAAARRAFQLYGKGRGHPARLNFGDCLSYAVAKVHGLPLLFKGDDFARTDVASAWRP